MGTALPPPMNSDPLKEWKVKAKATSDLCTLQGSCNNTPWFAQDPRLFLENRELRVQLVHQQQKLLSLQAQLLAANTSPTPPSITFIQTPSSTARPIEKRKARPSFLGGNCFTPESRKGGAEEAVRELRQTVKALEAEIEKLKKDHATQLKEKDDRIHELCQKSEKPSAGGTMQGAKRVVTRASLRPKEKNNGELKSPSHRFKSPIPTAKKRSFWDITTANSPSVATLNGRNTRSHVIADNTAAAPSMLLQVS
ncbi:kinesin motor family protein [Populus alba x Populus x berolinensis]|uniref:Kinesin motor family protein n=1 Tax=Populus alba x Populus x berolinensis TaxID=444605 RepID=A0AAD6M1A6_9ROSI|nr:kinesin motor family protein [Populus alba x Populus x berolinensis]